MNVWELEEEMAVSPETADLRLPMISVLVEGQPVSLKYDRENGKSKKAKAVNSVVFWSVRANSVHCLSRAEAGTPATTAAPKTASEEAPF